MNEVEAILLSTLFATLAAGIAIGSQRDITARQATISFIRTSEADRDMIEARNVFSRHSRDEAGLGPWALRPLSDEFAKIKMVLNEYEMVAIGIQRGAFDDGTYKLWYKSGVLAAWNSAAPFILARRNATGNQALWYEFEEMARYYRGAPPIPRRRFRWRKYF